MIMLDKRRASIFIKIGAVILALVFIISFIPVGWQSLRGGSLTSFFKSLLGGKRGQMEVEIERLEKIIKTDPKNLSVLVQLGNNYYDIGEYAKAVKYYNRALVIDASNVDVRVDMGAAYFALGQHDKALEAFKLATQLNPDHAMAWYNMGVVYKAKGDIPNLKFAWGRFLAIQPTGEQADRVRKELSQLDQ